MADLDVDFDFEPITVNSGPVTLTVAGLDNVKVDSKLAITQPIETKSTLSIPDTVKTDSKLTFTIPEPIRTDSKAAIDLQPVVVDQCLKLTLGALPPTLICLPNRQRIGLTLFGVEVFGFTLDGEARVVVSDLPKPPHVIHLPAPKEMGPPHHVGLAQPAHAVAPAQPAAAKQPFVIKLGG